MFQNLPHHADMKAAGDWLPELPAHWAWDPARTVFRERKDSGHHDEPLLSVTIARGVIPQAELLASTSKKDSSNADKSKYKLVMPGDLVYNKMRAWQGAAGLSRHRGIVSPAYIVMTPRRGKAAFFHHLVRTPMFAKEAERWSYGITSDQWSLRPEHFKMIRFPVPPAEEQGAIVKYLAHANARIDRAIAAKRRLVTLIQEEASAQVEALLAAVARDCSEPMFGRVLHRIEQGTSPSAAEGDFDDSRWAVLSLSAVNRGKFIASAVKPLPADFAAQEAMSVRDGDLLMTRSNTRERVGDAAIVRDPRPRTIMPDLIYRLVLRQNLTSPEFASLALRSRRLRNQIEVVARGSSDTMPKLAQGHVRALRVPLPSLMDQARIVAEADRISCPVENTIDRIAAEIELLSEFRTRLVADVVTGQVDVRGIAAELPDVDHVAAWGESDLADASDPSGLDDVLSDSEA